MVHSVHAWVLRSTSLIFPGPGRVKGKGNTIPLQHLKANSPQPQKLQQPCRDGANSDQRQGAARYPSTVLHEGATYGSCNTGRPPRTSPVLPRINRVPELNKTDPTNTHPTTFSLSLIQHLLYVSGSTYGTPEATAQHAPHRSWGVPSPHF